ncbi:MAG: NGG1p interacting factor NIF3 [Candidatus Omnitrophica bacterium]|nr:NGG1p interacting factor NIF3 [Candidatus Omnitrophota bacterium]
MKLSRFYELAIKYGRERDPRPRFKKGYADSAILCGEPDLEVKKILVGIDIEAPEILLADRLRQESGLDLVLAHHPEGRALARLSEVMAVQADILARAGFKRKAAKEFLEERMQEVERRLLPQNHTRPVDAARLLDLAFMCCHTPADNHAFWFISKLMKEKKPKTVQDIVSILEDVPEYRQAAKDCLGPRIILGSPRRPAGKILVEMTGGTEGSKDIFEKLSSAGVRTLVSMHLSDEHLKRVKDANLNVVIAGHISSDTLGLNLLFDRISQEEELQFIPCSGFKRIIRN